MPQLWGEQHVVTARRCVTGESRAQGELGKVSDLVDHDARDKLEPGQGEVVAGRQRDLHQLAGACGIEIVKVPAKIGPDQLAVLEQGVEVAGGNPGLTGRRASLETGQV